MRKAQPFSLIRLTPLSLLAACQPQLHPDLPTGPAAYDVLANASADQNGAYLLHSGDVVTVNVFQEPDLSVAEVAIDGSGNLYLPLIGEIRADGLSQAELSAQIQAAYANGYLRNPRVAVAIKSAMSSTVSVEGQVDQPGVYQIQPGATLLTAMALARSPTRTAKLDEVLIFRFVNGQRMGARFNLTDVRSGTAPDPQILPGDVVVVGYSSLRGVWRDILDAAPLFNVFTRF